MTKVEEFFGPDAKKKKWRALFVEKALKLRSKQSRNIKRAGSLYLEHLI